MDKGKALTREEALDLVRRYKAVIRSRFDVEPLGTFFFIPIPLSANPFLSINQNNFSEVSSDLYSEV